MAARETDVLIVGLGPVGAVLALLLAQWGVRSIAIERDHEVYKLPRAAHFDHEIMRVFQQVGIADALLPHTRALSRYEFRNAAGDTLMLIEQRDGNAISGWRPSYMFHQPAMEGLLRERLKECGQIQTMLGATLSEIEHNTENGVVARVVHDDGSEDTISARYLVGCDGGSSTTRRMAGIDLFDYGFDEPWLVIDTLVEDESMLPQCGLQHCDPARPTTVMPMSPGRRRWEFMLKPGETVEQVTDDAFIDQLLKAWLDPSAANVIRKAVYRFHGLVAKQWRACSVLLAGDAAHQMPPFLGQGMCSGVRDAASLAWRLGLVINHGASETLLDTYQTEREPHVRAIIETAIGMGRVVCTMDEAAAAARDREMIAARKAGAAGGAPFLPSLGEGMFHASPRAGEIFPQADTGSSRKFDDLAGEGFWLIGHDAHAADAPAFVRRHTLTGDVPALCDWLGDAEAVLVRPDRYVFGTGTPAALIAALKAQLQHR